MTRTAVAVSILVLVAGPLQAQSALPLVEDADCKALQAHVKNLMSGLEKQHAALPSETLIQLRPLLGKDPDDSVGAATAIQKVLDAHCLLGVSINPESRVKATRGPAVAELRQDEAKYVLIKIHNDAGVTAALTVTGPQVAAPGKTSDERWLEASVIAEAPFAARLGGQRVEYVVLKLTAHEAGKREATFKFDVGQGTQDLGYRAEVPILFTVRTR
jgi:hypothetical protein